MPGKMTLFAMQLVLFIDSGSIHADELSYKIRKEMTIGNFEPMVIPEQGMMPPEIPRLNINSDRNYRISMSKVRIDFVLESEGEITQEEGNQFIVNCSALGAILAGKNLSFSRIGFVRSWFVATDNPGGRLADRILSFAADGVTDINLTVTKKKIISGYNCNTLHSLANGFRQPEVPGYILARDINNVPREDLKITAPQIAGLVHSFSVEASENSMVEFLGGDLP